MFRLTAVLLAGLYTTMVIWGDPPQSDVAVTRDDTAFSSTVPSLGVTQVAAADAAEGPELSELTEREAIEAALAAGERQEPASTPAAVPQEEPEDTPALWYVTGSRVNLRAGPSTNAAVVGGVSLGDRAEVLSDPSEAWTQIRTEGGLEAWIYSRFLSEAPA